MAASFTSSQLTNWPNIMKLDQHHKLSTTTIAFHWLIAIGMIAMIIFGLYIEDLPRSPDKGELIGLHKSFGVILFAFAIARIMWRFKNKFPKPLSQLTHWQSILAQLAHYVLIIGTVMMPLSGVLMSIGGGHSIGVFGLELISGSGEKIESLSDIGHIFHGLGGKLIILFILLHIAGAIKHQVSDKDGTINRILGSKIAN